MLPKHLFADGLSLSYTRLFGLRVRPSKKAAIQ
jgi:hypothetical protein